MSSRTKIQIGDARNQNGEKPFKCDRCDSTFSHRRSLRFHEIRIHAGDSQFSNLNREKPHQCGQCNASFSHRRSLSFHKKQHTGENRFKCSRCSSTFLRHQELERHQIIHTGEKPYKCDSCDSSFMQNASLRAHKRTHTDEKPFKCLLCDSAFRFKGALKSHMRVHTSEKPYVCDQCGKSFKCNEYLKTHAIRVHSGYFTPRSILIPDLKETRTGNSGEKTPYNELQYTFHNEVVTVKPCSVKLERLTTMQVGFYNRKSIDTTRGEPFANVKIEPVDDDLETYGGITSFDYQEVITAEVNEVDHITSDACDAKIHENPSSIKTELIQ